MITVLGSQFAVYTLWLAKNDPGIHQPLRGSQTLSRMRAVNDIDISDARLERIGLEHLMARLTKTVNDVCGHTECLGRDQAHLQAVKQ